MLVYKFDKDRYITRGIIEDLPAFLALYLWQLIDERRKNKVVPMDYLQVLELIPDSEDVEKKLTIKLKQEEPPYEEVHSITHFTGITRKVYVIDDIDHVTMLLAEEY